MSNETRGGGGRPSPRRLDSGKIPFALVERALAPALGDALPGAVRLGPAEGEDAALVSVGGELWAIASDPITYAGEGAGRLAAIVNANDVAVRGARPRFMTATLLIAPDDADEAAVEALLRELAETCRSLGVALIGGHSEVTPGIGQSVIAGTMLGPVEERAVTTGGLEEGDLVGLTRHAGLEGTGILLDEHGEALRDLEPGVLDEDAAVLERLRSGALLSVVDEALAAARIAGVHALHDVTEGGVGQALVELASASGLFVEARREDVPLLATTRALCERLHLDPLGLIGSGALLVGCAPSAREELEAALAALDVPLTWIGRARARGAAGAAAQAERAALTTLPGFPRDELLRAQALSGLEGFIFDMDGTLVDSRYDWPAIKERLQIGNDSILDTLQELPDDEKARRYEVLHQIENEASEDAREMAGAAELLAWLRARRVPCALVTNNSERNAHMLLERFGLDLDVIVTREIGSWKPSGEPIVEAARRLGLDATRVAVVGDSVHDLNGAREAGAPAIIVHDEKGDLARRADHAFATLHDLKRALELTWR